MELKWSTSQGDDIVPRQVKDLVNSSEVQPLQRIRVGHCRFHVELAEVIYAPHLAALKDPE
eukprot:2481420-Amphidinium_carterae.1